MAELGAIGRWRGNRVAFVDTVGSRFLMTVHHVMGGAISLREDADGNPTPPSERQRRGVLRGILWPVAVGTRRFQIDVRSNIDEGAGKRPRIRVVANLEVGVVSDIVVSAGAGTGWQTLDSGDVVISANGVLEVWRELPGSSVGNYALWDNIVIPVF